jgi:hypothetical protein
MRNLMIMIVLLTFAVSAVAQEETLFTGNIETSGFGGPVVKLTRIYNQGAVMVGGRGGWIINHCLVIGGGGYGVVNDIDAPEGVLPLEGPLDIEFGYGGFEIEFIIHPNSISHFSFYTLVGAGGNNFVIDEGDTEESDQQVGESDFVVVVEPAINAELNVTTWFRLNAGVSYRMVTGVDQEGLDNSDFSGPSASLTFKFGRF